MHLKLSFFRNIGYGWANSSSRIGAMVAPQLVHVVSLAIVKKIQLMPSYDKEIHI